MNLRLLFYLFFPAMLAAFNPVMAQNNTLKSLKIELKEVKVCDTTFFVLRTTAEQQKLLASDKSVFMRLTEKDLDGSLKLLSDGSNFKLRLQYLSALEENVDLEVIELYKNEDRVYDLLRKKMSDEKKFKELLTQKEQAERAKKIATGELLSPRQAINSASKEIDSNPEGALMKLNEIIEKSNFNSSDDFIYKLTDYQYQEVIDLQVKCLAGLKQEKDIIPIYVDIQKKIKAKELRINASADQLYLSKIILLKTELKDTVKLYDYYKLLKGYIITKKETPQVSGTYAAISASKGQNGQNKELSVDELHTLALQAAEPFVKERYGKEEFERRKTINPHWGKQIASGSLFNSDQDEVEKILGKSSGKVAETHGENHYEAYVYNTANGKYHIVYRNKRAPYIVIYPNLNIKQKFDESELLKYGWKFNILNECSKESCGLSSTSGYVINMSYIDIYVEGGDVNYNTCTPYHVVFYSSDKKTVHKIIVYSI